VDSRRAGQDASRQLAQAGRDDERLHTYNKAPLLNRPGLLDRPGVEAIEQDLSALLDLLTSLPDRLFDGRIDVMCDRVGINGPERQAVLETASDTAVMLARADVVMAETGPKAIEFNIHSSLGGMDIAPLNETFLRLPVYGDFLALEGLEYCDPMHTILGEIKDALASRGMTGTPTVALVDWPTTYPIYEQVLERVCALMRAQGVDAFHTHLGTLERRNGHLWHGRTKIDVLYRIFMLEDLPEQPALVDPLLAVHGSDNVVLAMSFFAELVGNKATLALLSEAAEKDFLSADERAMVERILPQTRLLRPGRTTWHGELCDLLTLAVAKKDDLVLKPAIGHGTLGVVPGCSVGMGEWRRALDAACGSTFVLQERVAAVPEPVPVLDGDEWITRNYDVNWGVFIHGRRYAGAMLRAVPSGRTGVISLGAGGEVGCCFHEAPGGEPGE
jgi:hypothetical protein